MKVAWDGRKSDVNLRKHGFDLADAVSMFDDPLMVRPDTREDYGESRWIAIGVTKGRTAVVVFRRSRGRMHSNHFT